MIGDATLVPPKTSQPPLCFEVQYTETPVLGSAIAEPSATVRFEQPLSVCHAGLGSYALHPLPAPLHAVSLQPRAFELLEREVPPTAVTYCDAAGYCTP